MRRTLVVLVMATVGCEPEAIEHESGTDDGGGDAEATFPTRYAEAYCATLFACDPLSTCTDAPIEYASEADCVEGERTALEEAAAAARGEGLTFDPECVDRLIARIEEVGCDGEDRLLRRFGEIYRSVECQPYYGTVPVDEDPCFDIVGSNFTTCGRNLVCEDETCVASTAGCDCAEGQQCRPGDVDRPCIDILELGDTCILPPAEYPGVCPVDSYCAWGSDEDGDFTGPQACVPSEPLGAACNGDYLCASSACENDVCVAASPWLCRESLAPRHWR